MAARPPSRRRGSGAGRRAVPRCQPAAAAAAAAPHWSRSASVFDSRMLHNSREALRSRSAARPARGADRNVLVPVVVIRLQG